MAETTQLFKKALSSGNEAVLNTWTKLSVMNSSGIQVGGILAASLWVLKAMDNIHRKGETQRKAHATSNT
jgi:hypothetical protein